MIWVNEGRKHKFWEDFIKSKNKPIGITLTRLHKLKKIVWLDQEHFWYFIDRKPEDIGVIILEHMVLNKIIKS